ncbi:glycosyltransferase family 4 protein [Tamlana crocina]
MKWLKKHIKNVFRFSESLRELFKFFFFHSKKIDKSEIIFVLPYYQTGGAERVHLNIVQCVQDKQLCILFTHNSATENFKPEFYKYAEVLEVNKILAKNNDFVNTLLKKVLIKKINKNQELESIFGSNTNFFYEILPSISNPSKKLDLIHAISNENDTIVEHYIESASIINTRIVINKKAYNDVLNKYKINDVPQEYYSNLKIIENAIPINFKDELEISQNLNIGFVGRWSKEKRPEIFLEIAKNIKNQAPNVKFSMAGIGMKSNIDRINEAGVLYQGELIGQKSLDSFYKSLTFILVTSYREGFPMVIIEAMAHGVIPICTNVGGISEHISSYGNGVLIESHKSQEVVVKDFVKTIQSLLNDEQLRQKISQNAFHYARGHFNIEKFSLEYRKCLLNKLDVTTC